MSDAVYNVLILCTGNSARSILGEVLITQLGSGKFRGFSAGSTPKGAVHPMALEVLDEAGFPTNGLRSKSWAEFSAPDAPQMDFILTVCDNAAGEACPVWLGRPATAHWGIPDPAAVEGEGQKEAFLLAYAQLGARIVQMVELSLEGSSKEEIAAKLQAIGDDMRKLEQTDGPV